MTLDPLSTIQVDSYRYLVLTAGPHDPEAVEVRFGPTAADDPHDREIWQDWFRRHGIDPSDVVVRFAPLVNGEVLLEAKYVQLEGPPLPFPPIGPLRPPTTPETETP